MFFITECLYNRMSEVDANSFQIIEEKTTHPMPVNINAFDSDIVDIASLFEHDFLNNQSNNNIIV